MANKRSNRSTTNRNSGRSAKRNSGNTRGKKASGTRKTSSKSEKKDTGQKKIDKVEKTEQRSRGRHETASDSVVNMKMEGQIVVAFFVMILLMLSNFGVCGSAGNLMSGFLFGVFGCVEYVMPVAFFVMISVLLVNDYSGIAFKKCFAAFMVLMMISGFVHLFSPNANAQLYELFSISIKYPMSGGVIGGGIACLLNEWFGKIGAALIMLCILLLSMIMVTQRSLVGFFRKMWRRIQHFLRERRENRPAREARRRKSAEDKEREKQCEDKVKELEEQRDEARRRVTRNPRSEDSRENMEEGEKAEPQFRVPVFQPSDEVKRKDSVKELHPEIYPFTEEDGKVPPFEANLDFTAFSFNSGKTPDEYAYDLQERIKDNEELEKRVDDAAQNMMGRGMREIANLIEDSTRDEDDIPDDPAFDILPGFDKDEVAAYDYEEEISLSSEENERVTKDSGETDPSRCTSYSSNSSNKKKNVSEEIVIDPADVEESDIVIHKEETKKADSVTDVAKEAVDQIKQNFTRKKAEGEDYIFPPLSLLAPSENKNVQNFDGMLKATAQKLQDTLASFGVNVRITDISFGPAVTRYEMVPEQGTKVSKIVSLTDDIKLNLAAADIRIEAPIPGKSAIGIEVPNKETMMVHFRDLIDNKTFRNFKSRLAFAVGKDIGGKTVISDIATMPHLLIAGATGSGKSVCINTLIMSILYKARPDEVKLIMIDPKMVELSIYNGIPHLLIPVVTDPKKAAGALNWAVAEMTERYNQFTQVGVRNIFGYNDKVKHLVESGEVDPEKLKPMPQIVVIIDELADLMMVAPGDVEDAIVRLSQLARAAGIHLVIATQRPSVNVITGLIKANVPSRIAFAVSSGVDSRTIIDMNGAEKLLGKGDMLFAPAGANKPSRVQGAFISDDEISSVVEFLKENEDEMVYDSKIEQTISQGVSVKSGGAADRDEYFEDAARFLLEKEKASIGMLQRMFKIGFNRAARIMDQLAEAGIVGPEEGTKPRKILMSPEQLEQYFEEYL